MTCSPFQLKANQANALLSTGPRTPDGKARSRRNSYRHGLTGAGVVLPTEDEAEVQERFDAIEAELRPPTVMARVLARRVALMSIRLERSARQETVALAARVRSAEADFDEGRLAEVDRLFGLLVVEPAAVLRKLRRMPEGVERLIAAWGDLKNDLLREGGGFWSSWHLDRAENLTGRHLQPYRVSRFQALTAGLDGKVGMLDPVDLATPDLEAHCRDELARLMNAEVADLRDHLATLDRAGIARDRDDAVEFVLFDPAPAATLARKYEAAAERAMYKALDRIEAIREQAADPAPAPVPVDPGPETADERPGEVASSLPRGSSGSFLPDAPDPRRVGVAAPSPGRDPAEPTRPAGGMPPRKGRRIAEVGSESDAPPHPAA